MGEQNKGVNGRSIRSEYNSENVHYLSSSLIYMTALRNEMLISEVLESNTVVDLNGVNGQNRNCPVNRSDPSGILLSFSRLVRITSAASALLS